MAITKTKTVESIVVYPAADPSADDNNPSKYERVFVTYRILLDDPEDNELPVETHQVLNLLKYDNDGDLTNYDSEMSLVIQVCNAVWS